MKRKVLSMLTVLILCLSMLTITSAAASNPYPQYHTITGVKLVNCTWYAWQQAYDVVGVALPNWGDAGTWYNDAKAAGYSVGTTAKPKSIAVWSGDTYGHVSYVVSVNGTKMTVNEGGMLNSSGGAYGGTGIFKGNVVNSVVGKQKGNGSTKILVGFIYLEEDVSDTVTVSNTSEYGSNEIYETNAVLHGQVNKPSSYKITRLGIRIRKTSGSYSDSDSKFYYHTPSKDYSGYTYAYCWYDLNDEVGMTLTHATSYTYQIYAMVEGKEYYGPEKTFTTTGSHSYGSWTTTKAATCTASGTQKRTCSKCKNAETKSIAALGHNYYSSWTIDTAATCTTAGSKSHHCTRCSAKSDVTAIAATGHSFSAWKTSKKETCTETGLQTRSCSLCKITENKTVSAKGHSYSNAFTTDKAATCTAAGSKSRHCTVCDAKTDVTTVAATGHSFGEWKTTKQPTILNEGQAVRSCTKSGCGETETKTIAKLSEDGHTHKYGEWKTIKQATCIQDGTAERKCSICSVSETAVISCVGHSFGQWKVVKEATQEAGGEQQRKCANCSEIESQKIERLPQVVIEQEESAEISSEQSYQEMQDSQEYNSDYQSNDENNDKDLFYATEKNWLIVALAGLGILLIAAAVVIIILVTKRNK